MGWSKFLNFVASTLTGKTHSPIAELLLMFQLMDRVQGGVDPMIANLESYIVTTGLADMKASADSITSVSNVEWWWWY